MLAVILGRVAQFLLMLALLKISTYLLAPSEMGKMALVSSTIAFVSLFLVNPVGMYVNRQLHVWNTYGLIRHYLNYYWLYILLLGIVSAIILGGVNYFGWVDSHIGTHFLVAFIFLTLFFNTINQTSIPSLNMLGFRNSFILLSIATVLLGMLIALVLVYFYGRSFEVWMFGILAGQALLALIGTKIFYSKIKQPLIKHYTKINFANIKTVFAFSWPVAVAVGLTWFQSQSYRFFIEHFFGLPTLGLFVAGYGISAGIIAAFEAVFTTYFQPIFYQKVSASKAGDELLAWNAYAAAIIPSVVLLFFIITALAPKLTNLMLAVGYQASAKYVVWGAFIEIFRVIANVYGMAAHAKKDTKMLIFPNFVGATLAVGLIYCLIPLMGIQGIGLALAIAGLSVVLVLHAWMSNKFPLALPYNQIIKAISFGLLIWLGHYYLTLLFAPDQSLFLNLVHIGLIGIIALCAEFFLLRDSELIFGPI